MKRVAHRIVLICVAALAVPATTHAQPAAAVGHPLPDAALGAGTITIKVVDGSPSKPVVGTDVTLLVNGEARQARTDATGRATFAGLPAGAKVQAKVLDANQKEQASDEFPVPADGGVRVMLSISPFQGMGGMPPMAGGAGMPSARAMSGQPRPDRAEAPGSYVVRLTYDNLELVNGAMADDAAPVGSPVFLVAYGADDSVKVQTQQVGADGLATFTGLDVSGATAYYSLAALPRAGAVDRLIAMGTVLDGSGGARVVLSGEKRDAAAPAIDDYSKLIPRDPRPLAAGQVRVALDGVAPANSAISIIDARTGAVVGTANATPGVPDASQVTGGVDFADDAALALGQLSVEVRGGAGSAQEPLAGIEIRLVGEDGAPLPGAMGEEAVALTGADGTALVSVAPAALAPHGNQAKALVTINGKQMSTNAIDLRTQKHMTVVANWPTTGKPEALIAVAPTPGQVLYAQTTMAGQTFRSLPFLNLAEAGMQVNVYVFPRTLFRFDTLAFVEDHLLAFQGEMQVTNYSWAPYRAGNDGLVIELPKGFKGAGVAGADQEEVSVAEGQGLRILRPIPPGGRSFRMGYSMLIDNGEVDWAFKLPMGTWKSSLKIRKTGSMTVKLPDGIRGETRNASTGEPWFVIDDITLDRNKTLAISFGGFPAPPAWKVWAPRIVALFVVLLVGGGIAVAFTRRRDEAAERQERRERLLDELVELERKGDTGKRKEQLLAELEQLWTKT